MCIRNTPSLDMCSVSLFAWRKMATASPLHGDFEDMDEEDVTGAVENSDINANPQLMQG